MDKKTADRIDVGFLVVTLLNLIASAYCFNIWWGIAMTGFGIWLGVTEAGSKLRQKLTLTQNFKRSEWQWKKIWFFTSLNIFWIYLNIHLLLTIWIWQ